MSQSGVYSTFRTPQAKKQRPPIENGDYGPYWRTFSEGRGRRSEGIYATPSLGSGPAVSTAFSPSESVKKAPAVYNNTIKNGRVGGAISKFENKGGSGIGNGENLPPGHNSKLGNGFQTLPSSLYRGVRLYDPLNNVNRFQKRRSGAGTDSPDTGSLNNFEFYRKQQQQQQEPPSKNSTSSRSGSSSSSSGYGYGNMSYLHSKPGGQEHQTGTRNKPPHENKPSLLLSPDENRFIFEILGRGRQTLATAVGRLLTPTPDQQQWQVKDSTGAVCLVRDTTKKSYFIQVFSLRAKNMIFRQEIYNQFEYQMPQATFMTFEGDSSVVAILFADSTEASNFRDALDGKLEAKRQRRNERETRRSKVLESQVNNVPSHHTPQSNNHYASNNNNNVNNTPPSYPNGHAVTTTTTYTFPTAASTASAFKFNKKSKGKDKDKKKTKLTAKDIGTPMDFRHVQHVGWDPTKGFDLNLEDKDLRTFFEKAGVSANQLNDEKTRKFIYNFIEQNGGLDVVKRSANLNTPLRAPPPVPPSSGGSSAPPPVPTRTPSIPNSNYPGSNKPPPPPPPPSRPVPPAPPAATHPGVSAAVPPPPPARTTSHANQNSPTQYHNNHHQHPISNGPSRPPLPKHIPSNGPAVTASPPPPPPPPMPVPGAAPPPPPPPPPMSSPPSNNGLPESNGSRGGGGGSSLPPVSDDRSQLMQQIQKGIQLRKVEPDSQPKRVGGISDCLSEIQKGVDLKPVPESAKAQPSLDAMDGLAGALARALADRNRALNPDSSSSDDDDQDEYDDEDWE